VDWKRSSAASKICVPKPVDGKGFEQEVIVRSGVAGDVASLLKLLRDSVAHDKAVENISEAICEQFKKHHGFTDNVRRCIARAK
jgi:hypothetical protein